MNDRGDLGVYGDGRVPDDPPRRDLGDPGQGVGFGSDQLSCTCNYRSRPQQTARFRRVLTHRRRTDLERDSGYAWLRGLAILAMLGGAVYVFVRAAQELGWWL